ncbi:MAG: hypothetical protein IT559_01470 [Alphaproteobacteria bacterium]|nr:hypothetical protein [Alphaproteobacteria bacterium]
MEHKKAFYIMTFTALWAGVADSLAEEHGVRPALYVGLGSDVIKNSALGAVPFYDVNAARMASMPDNIEGFSPASLDPEIIESFAPHQAILHEMVSRFLLSKRAGSFESRRQHLWQMIRIWEGLFDHFKPDVVIAASMPHRVFDYLIYLICERRGVPFIALEATSLPHLTYACTSIHHQSASFDSEQFEGKSLPALSKETADFFEFVRNPGENYRPYNVSLTGMFKSHEGPKKKAGYFKSFFNALPQSLQILIALGQSVLKGQLRTPLLTRLCLTKPSVFSKEVSQNLSKAQTLAMTLLTARRVDKARKHYERHLGQVDYDRPYIYFPANFMPERSTVPDSGYFYDYFLIFSMLERIVPKDWQIIFKEHPRSFMKPVAGDNPRDVDFFLRLREACPRITFIPPTTDSKKLVKHCAAVAIASGTTGWEAIARGKPVLLFGEYWYGRCEGVYRIHSLSDLRAAFESIEKTPEVPEDKVLEYLKRVESVSENFSYYYIDNVEERSRIGGSDKRMFTEEEQRFRQGFIKNLARYLHENIKNYERAA